MSLWAWPPRCASRFLPVHNGLCNPWGRISFRYPRASYRSRLPPNVMPANPARRALVTAALTASAMTRNMPLFGNSTLHNCHISGFLDLALNRITARHWRKTHWRWTNMPQSAHSDCPTSRQQHSSVPDCDANHQEGRESKSLCFSLSIRQIRRSPSWLTEIISSMISPKRFRLIETVSLAPPARYSGFAYRYSKSRCPRYT